MVSIRPRMLAAPALFLVFSSLASCGMSSKYMRAPETATQVAVDGSQATVVFVRPSSFGGRAKWIVVDQNARFLGESWGNTWYAAQMPPGHYTFVSWSEGSHSLQADLAAGKVYYVELAPTMGAWSGRMRLRALGPGREHWADLPQWLKDSKMLEIDPAGQAYCDARKDRVLGVVKKGLATFAGYDEKTKAERTLRPEDGVATPVQ